MTLLFAHSFLLTPFNAQISNGLLVLSGSGNLQCPCPGAIPTWMHTRDDFFCAPTSTGTIQHIGGPPNVYYTHLAMRWGHPAIEGAQKKSRCKRGAHVKE
eukprot:scaffold153804_cov18-Tisochrysis_lutea.AAC.2